MLTPLDHPYKSVLYPGANKLISWRLHSLGDQQKYICNKYANKSNLSILMLIIETPQLTTTIFMDTPVYKLQNCNKYYKYVMHEGGVPGD